MTRALEHPRRSARKARRPVRPAVWLAALALLVQLTAPFGAMLAMAGSILDDAPICAAHESGGSPDRPHSDQAACPLCQVCCVAPQLLVPDATPPAPTPQTIAFLARPTTRPGLPRGPPADPPNARAPPPS